MLELLHYAPEKCDPQAEVLSRKDCGDYIREEVRFNTTPVFRVPATVLIPKNARLPAPAVVALHSHGGFYMWDAPNGVLSAPYPSANYHASPRLWFALVSKKGTTMLLLLGLNATHLLFEMGVRECGWDAFASAASEGVCVPMPCTRAALCDASNGLRERGNTSCGCLPGFFLMARHSGDVECAPCAPPRFCVGGQARPSTCPSVNAETLTPRARSSADCVCVPGTFALGAQCLD
jgi:hypothetical protein